ncbi:hypothetical protein Ancab_030764 [Ancistrocladus abbreviatus]
MYISGFMKDLKIQIHKIGSVKSALDNFVLRASIGGDCLVVNCMLVNTKFKSVVGASGSFLKGWQGQSNSVTKNSVSAIAIGVWTSNDTNHRQILAINSGDDIEDTESSDGEGDDAGTDSTRSCIASIALIAATDEIEVEVSRDGEDVIDANLDEALGEVPTKGGFRRASCQCCLPEEEDASDAHYEAQTQEHKFKSTALNQMVEALV